MKWISLIALFTVPLLIQGLEYKIQFDNEEIRVSKIKLLPKEELGVHRDKYPRVVVGLKGGTFTRIEADGSRTQVNFPTEQAIFLPPDPEGQFHSGENGNTELEIIVIELKR